VSAAPQANLEWTLDNGNYPRTQNNGKFFDREDFDLNAPIYLGSGLEVDATAHFAARESAQNSIDAFKDCLFQSTVQPVAPCHIKVRYVTLTGKDKKKFLSDLGVDPQDLLKHYKGLPEEKDREKVLDKALKRLADFSKPLYLLYIEEETASGMYHSKNKKVSPSKLYAATLDINESDKDDTAGGSYGQGKTALLAASRLQLNVVYTEYGWHEAPGHKHAAALLGFCSWPAHELGEKEYTGYSYVCDDASGNAPVPYRDDAARALAKKMGFERDQAKPGSAVLIVDPAFSYAEFEKALLANWWPALLAGTVKISISESTGFSTNPTYKGLDPRTGVLQKALAGFCAAYDAMKASPATEHGIGTLGLVEHDLFDPAKPVTVAFVAKMRQIGLVVEYQKVTNARVSDGKAVCGCFQADAAADRLLRRTENKGHTRWGTGQKRDSEGTQKAEAVQTRIREQVLEFVGNIRQQQATPSKVSSVLSRILEKFSNNPGAGARGTDKPPKNPRSSAPASASDLVNILSTKETSDSFSLTFEALRDDPVKVAFCYVQDNKALGSSKDVKDIAIEIVDDAGTPVPASGGASYSLKKGKRYTAKTSSSATTLVKDIIKLSLDDGWQVTES